MERGNLLRPAFAVGDAQIYTDAHVAVECFLNNA